MIQGTSPLFSCYTVPHMCHYQHQKVSQDPVGTCQDWLSGLICLHQHQEWYPWLTSGLNRKNLKKFKTKWNNMNVRIHIHFEPQLHESSRKDTVTTIFCFYLSRRKPGFLSITKKKQFPWTHQFQLSRQMVLLLLDLLRCPIIGAGCLQAIYLYEQFPLKEVLI